MAYPPRDDDQDFGFDDPRLLTKTRWHGSAVEIRARLVPRYLWTTASIDVFLDEQCILRTGGQMKITGSSSAEFHHDGALHTVELSWGSERGQTFPFQLRIDGAKVDVSQVPVENAGMLIMPALILTSLLLFGLWMSSP